MVDVGFASGGCPSGAVARVDVISGEHCKCSTRAKMGVDGIVTAYACLHERTLEPKSISLPFSRNLGKTVARHLGAKVVFRRFDRRRGVERGASSVGQDREGVGSLAVLRP